MYPLAGAAWHEASHAQCPVLPCITLSLVLTFAATSGARLWADDSQALTDASPQGDIAVEEDAGTAVALIQAMAQALDSLTYEGEFVHVQGASLTSMHISRSAKTERLRALDGEARIVLREGTLVTFVWPDSQKVVVSRARSRELLSPVDTTLADNPHYEVSLGARDRVAGRQAQIVDVRPRDTLRYGYRFWVDSDNNMLLRSMLLDNGGQPVEQLIFTDISFPESLELALFDTPDTRDMATWLESRKTSAIASLDQQNPLVADRVRFGELPQGYYEVAETFSSSVFDSGPVSHVMLTDGMSSVSVYVEYVTAGRDINVTQGHTRMGAVNAYSRSVSSALITAVGEVPAATVKALADAVLMVE